MSVLSIQVQLRHDTAANWTSYNPILKLGEVGVETNTYRIKIGDGSTQWNTLGYFKAQSSNMLGSIALTSGASDLVVTGLGLQEVPTVVLVTMRKPNIGADTVTAMTIDGSFSTDGFVVEFSGEIPSSGYKLDYMIL